ncbi:MULTISPECIES: hypothetical protein [Methylocaldum]|jgi:hypothetical protein|uniref:hypothetical protein n=1 Tax=unclassified Methylocaldum TaxID=2622260 RepID=UPI00098A2AFD|nr:MULTISPECIES: hypothetical protein [unclassified Methylocaldum]MBP1151383.1 hypothetical protein [Methylocaldum sp. RMAD-M]MDV3241358.1 hypothetical protein [Methylocaldum sp.]MVF23870.1 hypothetical protein [Methylocaldum sp. BRCS4]
MNGPTDEGKKRYPPNGLYQAKYMTQPHACTCTAECTDPCDGEDCGCSACLALHDGVASID